MLRDFGGFAINLNHSKYFYIMFQSLSQFLKPISMFRSGTSCFTSYRIRTVRVNFSSFSRSNNKHEALNRCPSQRRCMDQRQRISLCLADKILLHKKQMWDSLKEFKRLNQSHRSTTLNYSTVTPFNVNRKISQDALIFSYKNDSFFKMISIFGVLQMMMWGYLSFFSVRELRSGPAVKMDTSNLPWWQKALYTEGRYKNAISVLCFTLGTTILFITLTYPRRAVKKLWLLKGGKDVEITTYSWFGQIHTFKAPVKHISCFQPRTGSGSQVPFKIKDKYFYYLLDKQQGSFHNPELFDFVIGLNRNLE